MEKNFKKDYLFIGLSRTGDNNILLHINSEYSRSDRKAQLWVNQEKFADEVLGLWKSIATKKLLSIDVSFGEIDHYDSMTDIYEVPCFHIERGLRKARISQREHGTIPKDWEINFNAVIEDTKTITPVIEVIKETLGSLIGKYEDAITKVIRPFLKDEIKTISYTIQEEKANNYR